MLKLFNTTFTNKQLFVNKTIHQVKVTISSCDNIFMGTINGNDNGYVDVKRNTLGTVKAKVNLTFQNGIQIEYSFGVSAKNCTDHIDIYENDVIYNGKRRGSRTCEPFKELIDLGDDSKTIELNLHHLTINGLKDMCCQKNVSTNGCKTKQDYIDKLELYNDKLLL